MIIFRKEKGAILVIFALSIIPLIGIVALVIDLANIFYDEIALQGCTDSAVLGSVNSLNLNPKNKNKNKNKKATKPVSNEATLRANSLYAANVSYLEFSPSYTVDIVSNTQASINTTYTSPTFLVQIIQPSWVSTKFNFTSYAEISPSTSNVILVTSLS